MNRIKELPKASSQLLSSTQIISSVHSVVKELVENALDSSATNIEIKLEDFGLAKIEVKDNGKGIHKDDINFVAKPHCTSKITSHLDLNEIESYGFRGEALAALCTVSELGMSTKTAEENFGFTYTFDHNGNVSTSKPCPCNQGTSVVSLNLFKNIPVRRQFYRSDKNKKEELKKVEDILIAFGCIQTGVRFILFHDRNLIWQKPSVNKVREGLVQIFGNAVVDHMENCEFNDEDSKINIDVFLPNQNAPVICSQTTVNRSIVAINKRPVRMKVIDKLLKEYYNKAVTAGNKARYPICYIAIEVPPSSIDVNYEPNKTAVAMENTSIIVDQLSKILSTFYYLNPIPETNGPKDTPTSSSPQIPIDSTPEILSEVINKNTLPTFQMKLSQIAPDFKKPALSSKLSRARDPETPSTKRRRTSSFSTPPNDIHRHINTLNSFFSTEKAKDVTVDSEKANKSGFVLPGQTGRVVAATAQRTPSNGVNEHNIDCDLVYEQTVTLNRKNVLNSDIRSATPHKASSELDGKQSAAFAQKVRSRESSELKSQNNLVSANRNNLINTSMVDVEHSDKTSPSTSLSNRDTTQKRTELSTHFFSNKSCKPTSDELNIMNVDEEISNVILPSRKNHESDLHENDINLDAIFNDSKESNARKANNQVPQNEWSRGLHSAESNIQPVAVLKPKVVGKNPEEVIPLTGIDNLGDKKSLDEVSPIQRKFTAFDFFCRKHRLEVASLNPDFNNHQIAQILTEKWSRISSEEKEAYKNITSNDYLKNNQNKENPGEVAEVLNKTKNKSRTYKKVSRKMKRKFKESSIVFNLDSLKEHIPLSSGNEEDLNILSCLKPGIWICSQKHKLYVLNCFRLQEAIVFQRLLETYQLEPEPIESPFRLTSDTLGDEAMNVLSNMTSTIVNGNTCIISDENITANGFRIRFLKGEGENHFEVLGITQNIAFYGVPDLKEILHIIQQEGSVDLSHSRPKNVIQYLQGEAIRIARQFPASKNLEDAVDLLEKRKLLSSNICIHSKPILHELYSIPSQHSD